MPGLLHLPLKGKGNDGRRGVPLLRVIFTVVVDSTFYYCTRLYLTDKNVGPTSFIDLIHKEGLHINP